jgi:prepilin-type N-terminal cleavage/methylation domain-containing protein/prepilin-type processing-associated H-X9-DG protein
MSQQKNQCHGFTLPEILVVILILAMLAAILYPAFDQARANRSTAICAENERHIAFVVLQYAQDNDGTFPIGLQNDWNNSWPTVVMGYLRSTNSFHCPEDHGTPAAWTEPWGGIPISYASNGILSGPDTNGNIHGNPQESLGIMAWAQPQGLGWQMPDVHTVASVTRPANTIMICEKHNSDVMMPNSTGGPGWGNLSSFAPGCIVQNQFNWDGLAADEMPLGTRAPAPYPVGPNGSVSAHHDHRANFAFCDGHVKLMNPALTNPHGGSPAGEKDDLWDSTR